MECKEVSWRSGRVIQDQSPTGGLREHNLKFRGQGFPPEVFRWLQSEYLAACLVTEAETKVANWFRSYGRSVSQDLRGLLVDGKRIDVQRQAISEPLPRLLPRRWDPDAYVITNGAVTRCLIVLAKTSPWWSPRLGWHEFPLELAKTREIRAEVTALL